GATAKIWPLSPVATKSVPSAANAKSQMYFIFGSKNTDFSPFRETLYTLPSGEVPIYSVPFASNAIVWASKSVDSKTALGLPVPSKRKTFAGDPPAAYSTPPLSVLSDHKYDASASDSNVNFGASSRCPSLRTAIPLAVPFRNSSYVDCRQRRVCWASLAKLNARANDVTATARSIICR